METKSVLKSKTLVGALVVLVAFVVKQQGLPLLEGEVELLVVNLVALLGLAVTVYGRLTAKTRLTL